MLKKLPSLQGLVNGEENYCAHDHQDPIHEHEAVDILQGKQDISSVCTCLKRHKGRMTASGVSQWTKWLAQVAANSSEGKIIASV